MKAIKKKHYIIPIIICVVELAGLVFFYLTGSLSKSDKCEYVYIDDNDNLDSIAAKLKPIAKEQALLSFKLLARHSGYSKNIRTGKYAIEPEEGIFAVLRKLKNGHQIPVRLTIPESRTTDRLAGALSRKLMMDSLTRSEEHTSELQSPQ